MFEVDINGKKVKAEVSFYTAQLYESEFMSDLVQDILGKQQEGDGEFVLKNETFTDEDGDVKSTVRVVGVDFTKIGWLEVTRALWAAVKTADPSTPGFSVWSRQAKGTNLWQVRRKVAEEIDDCFFRSEDTGEEGQGGN